MARLWDRLRGWWRGLSTVDDPEFGRCLAIAMGRQYLLLVAAFAGPMLLVTLWLAGNLALASRDKNIAVLGQSKWAMTTPSPLDRLPSIRRPGGLGFGRARLAARAAGAEWRFAAGRRGAGHRSRAAARRPGARSVLPSRG